MTLQEAAKISLKFFVVGFVLMLALWGAFPN
jgi:hypothetical protein